MADRPIWDINVRWSLEADKRLALAELVRLEKASLDRRYRNHCRLMLFASRGDASSKGPQLETLPASEDNRRLKLLAVQEILGLCIAAFDVKNPQKMRSALKNARDKVGHAILYETELARFLRAKNRKIGQLQVWLDKYLGPDPAPVAQWGRGAHLPDAVDYDAVRVSVDPLGWRIVAPGAPPLEPEFQADLRALLKAARFDDGTGYESKRG